MSDYEPLRAVMYSRNALQDTANKAQARLDEMKQEFKALLKEQEAIVEAAEKMRSDYAEESLKWEISPNRGLPPGSSYTVKKKMGVYTRNKGTVIPLHYPWMPWTPAFAPIPLDSYVDDRAAAEAAVLDAQARVQKLRDECMDAEVAVVFARTRLESTKNSKKSTPNAAVSAPQHKKPDWLPKKRKREIYKCTLCGEPKKGHICPIKSLFPSLPAATTAVQQSLFPSPPAATTAVQQSLFPSTPAVTTAAQQSLFPSPPAATTAAQQSLFPSPPAVTTAAQQSLFPSSPAATTAAQQSLFPSPPAATTAAQQSNLFVDEID